MLASNTARRAFNLYNDSSSAVYIKFGSSASTTSFTVKLAAAGYYESPTLVYRGIVTAIWDTATGSMRITELT
jgi:hypothetical protein